MAAAVINSHQPIIVVEQNDDTVMIDAFSTPTPIQIKRPTGHHQKSFSWSDFPLLTEDILYVDPSYHHQNKEKLNGCRNKRIRPTSGGDDENDMFSSNSTVKKITKTSLNKAFKTKAKITARSRNNTSRKKVHFDAVHIREHKVTLGDHEWCEGTLAVTLDWPHIETPKSMLINDYESMRQRQGRVPRGRLPKLEHWQRKQLLQKVGGMSEEEINAVENMMGQQQHNYYAGLSRTKTVPNLAAATEMQHYV